MKELKKTWIGIIAAGGIIVCGLSIYFIFFQHNNVAENIFTVKHGDIEQIVDVNGHVKAATEVDLALEKGGRVIRVGTSTGSQVKAQQILIETNHSDLDASLAQANAATDSAKAMLSQAESNLATQKAKLLDIQSGNKPEDIQASQTKVTNAEFALTDAKNSLESIKNKAATDLANLYSDSKDILNNTSITADTVMTQQIYNLFTHDNPQNIRLAFLTSDSQLENTINTHVILVSQDIEKFKSLIVNLSNTPSEIDQAFSESKIYLGNISSFLDKVNNALAIIASNISPDTLTLYKANVNTARSNINASIRSIADRQKAIAAQIASNESNIANASTAITNAQNILASAKSELTLKKTGATPTQIATQEAQIEAAAAGVEAQKAQIQQAEANAQSIRAQISKSILRSPISGTVTKQDAKLGQDASAGTPLISIISNATYQIESFVSDADIAKVKVGNAATITLDAYGSNKIFQATVMSIDPAATITQGVPTYKVTLQFSENSPDIKTGMTANANIITATHKNVLIIPETAILRRGSESIVLTKNLNKEKAIEHTVTIGLNGNNGMVEIISGLSEADTILQY